MGVGAISGPSGSWWVCGEGGLPSLAQGIVQVRVREVGTAQAQPWGWGESQAFPTWDLCYKHVQAFA